MNPLKLKPIHCLHDFWFTIFKEKNNIQTGVMNVHKVVMCKYKNITWTINKSNSIKLWIWKNKI